LKSTQKNNQTYGKQCRDTQDRKHAIVKKGKMYRCTGTEALYRLYGP